MMTLLHFLRVVSPSLFIVLGFACAVVGQTETATVSGLVTDRTTAAVSGAEVRLQSVERGTLTTTTTNDAGIYVFPSVQPGQYQISIQKKGFKQVDLLGLVVNVQDHIEQNFRLEVGSIAESVTVEATASMINTTDGSVSTVVDQTYVKNMPLNGRSFQDLILLTPGTVTQTPQNIAGSLGTTGEFSVNGQRPESNYYTVDGVSANVGGAAGTDLTSRAAASGSLAASTALGTTQALVSVDALQEFRVQTSTYSAEYGRNPGGQFAFETKSGANQWHGTAYDYLRNGALDATDWFNNYFQQPEPAIRQNDFGGTLGGPVKVPHLYNGNDKTFFFVSYEGLRLTAPQPATPSYVPDAALRSSVPAALRDALNAFPLPSPNGVDDTANGVAQFIGSWSNPSSLNSTSVRFDHIVTDKVKVFFRFSDTASRAATRGTNFPQGFVPNVYETSAYTMRTYTAGASSVFSSHVSNDLRLNYSSNEATGRYAIDGFGGATPIDLLQVLGLGSEGRAQFCICYNGYGFGIEQNQQSGTQKQWNLVDSVGFSLGRHQFKFGVDYRRLAPFSKPYSPFVAYSYDDQSQIMTNTGDGLVVVYAPAYPLFTNFSAFAQDEWRISHRLSVSLGLRWEVNPAPGVTQGLKPYAFQGSSSDTFTLAPQGAPLWQTKYGNFAPRVGAAYVVRSAPGRETVARGGFGVFYDTGQQLGATGFTGAGFSAVGFSTLSFPSPGTIPPIVNPPVAPYGFTYGFDSHLQLPYTLQWNASIEQALGRSQTLAFSYVGSHATRLLRFSDVRPLNNPNFDEFFFVENGLTSDYDSLQAQFRRRLTRGLTALASYTWSHCLDYGSQNYSQIGYRRGNCDFDVRHNLSVAFSHDLPNVGHNGFEGALLHQWGLDGRFTGRTAFPVTLNGRRLRLPNGEFVDQGLDTVQGQPIYLYGANCDSTLQNLGNLKLGQGCPGGRAINPCAFVLHGTTPGAPCFTSGTVPAVLGLAPRNFARGFGAWQMDLAVRRDFPIHERLKLQFRAEAFNIFNHPNFGRVNGGLGQANFGQATATLASSLGGVLNPLYQVGGPRSTQFALKLVF